MILTHGIPKMAAADEHDHEHYAFSMDFFTFISTKSCELARGRLLSGSGIQGVNRVNKKIRKKHFFDTFPPIFATDRLTDHRPTDH